MIDVNAAGPRRQFLGQVAAGSAALLASASSIACAAPAPAGDQKPADAAASPADAEWLGKLHGSYRQLFDITEWNSGFPLAYAFNWAKSVRETYNVGNDDVCAAIGLRHMGIGPAFSDAIWAKYKLGEFFKINDPKTKAPSVRNFAYLETEGDMQFPGSSIGKQLEAGAVVSVCNLATTVLSGFTAQAAGLKISAADAYAEWKAALQPGCHLVPTGVLAVHRFQNPGKCTYCYGG